MNRDCSTGRTSSKHYGHCCYPSYRTEEAGCLTRYSSGPFWTLLRSFQWRSRSHWRISLSDSWLGLIWHLLFCLVRLCQGQSWRRPNLAFISHCWRNCPDLTLFASLGCSGQCVACSYCYSIFPFFFTPLCILVRTFLEGYRWWGQLS